jgi:ABC-type multidrug transport system ATPase subunit
VQKRVSPPPHMPVPVPVPVLLGLGLLGLGLGRALGSVGFVPGLSSPCATALANLSMQVDPYNCGSLLSSVLLNQSSFSTCTTGVGGVNCFDIGEVRAAATRSKHLVPAYRLPPPSPCALCTPNSGMIQHCLPILEALSATVYNVSIDYSAFSLSPSQVQSANTKASQAAVYCSSTDDQASTQILQYQSELLCTSSDLFGRSLTATGTIEGILDLRPLTQCGICAVLPCLPGQLCDGSGSAMSCPEGSYCPSTAQRFDCPQGFHCPEGSTAPLRCRGSAAGSCSGDGSEREVAWIPLCCVCLFLAVLVLWERTRSSTSSQRARPMPTRSSPQYKAVDTHNASLSRTPVSISFEQLRLQTKQSVRLNGVSGTIRAARFTAIVGGSGAGKTSLLQVLLGREVCTSGQVVFQSLLRLEPLPVGLLRRALGFVPQGDVFLGEMTVRDLVLQSARWRSCANLSEDQLRKRVDAVLEELGLSSLQHCTASNGASANSNVLSPGDRRKLNIAIELVSDPLLLFLDEPTTNIDASSALSVAQTLHQLARSNLTCVAVLHQPRAEIFQLIDDLIVLVKGGRLAFHGPARAVLRYFQDLGCELPATIKNKTDFVIDLTSQPPPARLLEIHQLAQSTATGASINSAATVDAWADLWDLKGQVCEKFMT